MKFGEKIKKLRDERQMSLSEFAEILGTRGFPGWARFPLLVPLLSFSRSLLRMGAARISFSDFSRACVFKIRTDIYFLPFQKKIHRIAPNCTILHLDRLFSVH